LENKSASVTISLTTSISQSEDPSKILIATRNVFGNCNCHLEQFEEIIRLTSSDVNCLKKIRDQFRDRRIRTAARMLLLKNRKGNRLSILLNRQAAFEGIIALCNEEDESPLGPILLVIESETPDSLIEWLTAY
jgi:predicted RNA binding protein with dsRBD fold (UPF0201 family)